MEEDTKFIDGLYFDRPREGAPDFVKGRISIKAETLIAWMKENKEHLNNGFFNIDLLKSKAGKLYCKLNTYKKEDKENTELTADDIPF